MNKTDKTKWQTKKLGEVLEYEQPSLYIVSSKNYKDDYETPVLTAGKSFILGKTKEKNGIFPKDKLPVIIFDDFTTATQFVDFPFKVKSSAMKILHPVKNISNAKFLFHLMQNISFDHTGIHKRYWISEYSKIEILLPPLPEQHRIVKILDEVFADVAKAKENAEKNLQNAKELFESYLQSVFANPGKDWEEKILGEVCDFYNGKAHEKAIDPKGSYIVINSKFISSDGEKYKRTKKDLFPLFKNDIVMVMSDVPNGKALAKCFIVDKNETYSLNQRICAIRSKVFQTRFLYLQLNRHKYLLGFNNGENQTNLRKNDILNCPLFIPPIFIQKNISAKLDALSAETKKLESIYQQKLADLWELKKSILKRAFNGDL
jgi:type I restriction enzyme S subunit